MTGSCFVYINNERVELLEDRRLHLYAKYAEGTILMDPSSFPSKQIPLSQLPDEHGVTARKLLPFGHYHAFRVDPATGERQPVHVSQKYLMVHNLPPHATAEFIGKYFEQFDYIVEGDIVKVPGQPGVCKGRGYVQFANPDTTKNLLMQCRTLMMTSGVAVWLDSSDQKPRGCALPPPQYAQHHHTATGTAGTAAAGGTATTASAPGARGAGPSSGTNLGGVGGSVGSGGAVGTAGGQPSTQSFVDPRVPLHGGSGPRHHHHHHGGGALLPPPPPAAVATCANHYYFITHIFEEHIQTSVRDGIFWPTKVNQRSFYGALERGPVYLLFLMMQRPALFGYARVTQRDMVRNKHANFTLEWVKHSVYLNEENLRTAFPAVQILAFSDGTPLKPELGQAICEYIDTQPSKASMPSDLPYINPSPTTPNAPRSVVAPSASNAGPGSATASGGANNASGTPSSNVPPPRSAQSPTSYGTPTHQHIQALPSSASSSSTGSPHAHHHHVPHHHHHLHHHHIAHHHHHHHHHHHQPHHHLRGGASGGRGGGGGGNYAPSGPGMQHVGMPGAPPPPPPPGATSPVARGGMGPGR